MLCTVNLTGARPSLNFTVSITSTLFASTHARPINAIGPKVAVFLRQKQGPISRGEAVVNIAAPTEQGRDAGNGLGPGLLLPDLPDVAVAVAADSSLVAMDPTLTALHSQQVANAATALQQAVLPQQQTPVGTPQQQQQQQHHHHGPGRPPNADRQIVIDGRRFQRLEENVSKLLELTQLMMNRQEELNDRMVQREHHLQSQITFTEDRLQLAMEGGAGAGVGGPGVTGGAQQQEEDDDEEEDEEEEEEAHEPPDMAYPPLGMQFRPNFGAKKPLEGLLDNINLWAKEHGYKCATLRSTQKPGERVRVAIRCALGGEARYKVTDENGEALIRTKTGQLRKPYRKRTSKKTGCEFGFILGETGQGTNVFEVRYHPNGSPPHNHPPQDL